jgi:sterol desaturase/sphingolipid hydroxylase (fatty acid hydroxylase superfamily)
MNEVTVRLLAFVAVFALMASLEFLLPRRRLRHNKLRRWITNLGIVGADSLLVRLMAALPVPIAAVAAALHAQNMGWGLFNVLVWPEFVEVLLAMAALDFALWLQHLVFHKMPLLWRVHRMHHADPDIDVTTAIRFHPIEIALSMVWKIIWVFCLGASVTAVLAFEIVLNASAMFNHANVRLPLPVDDLVRRIFVTPDMHRIHHSVDRAEHNSNYGFCLSIWDRLFATYTPEPAQGHEKMSIGLKEFQSDAPTKLVWSLRLPFEKDLGDK